MKPRCILVPMKIMEIPPRLPRNLQENMRIFSGMKMNLKRIRKKRLRKRLQISKTMKNLLRSRNVISG